MADDVRPPLGPRLQKLRKERRLTLDTLSQMSGVSRSMLSQIERGQANPTVATVWALADALHMDISELLQVPNAKGPRKIDVAAPSLTPEMRSDDGLCVLKVLSPADRVGSVEWYQLHVAPGGVLRSEPHARGSMEHLTVLKGTLTIEAVQERTEVPQGSTARYAADIPHCIENRTAEHAEAILVNLF
ncbi:helix-turn-helix domain-containing protein [Pacificimonas sp. ICDLI1SI03]